VALRLRGVLRQDGSGKRGQLQVISFREEIQGGMACYKWDGARKEAGSGLLGAAREEEGGP